MNRPNRRKLARQAREIASYGLRSFTGPNSKKEKAVVRAFLMEVADVFDVDHDMIERVIGALLEADLS